MDVNIRFSSPVLDDLDLELLKDTFDETIDNVIEILDSAPYEISIITCLLGRLVYKLDILKQE